MEEARIVLIGNYMPSQFQSGNVYGIGGVSPTVMENHGKGVQIMDNIRIRKLTPKECARLMGWNDECYERMAKVNSNSQIYKECGNAIVIQCLEAIFGQMFEGKEDFYKTSYEQLQKNNFKWETN